jgi:hypothetical protein
LGSSAIAWRPVLQYAICCAVAARQVAMGTSDATRSGNITPHSSTCMPPIDPPSTLAHRSMPSASASRACTRTMSRTVTTGKREP